MRPNKRGELFAGFNLREPCGLPEEALRETNPEKLADLGIRYYQEGIYPDAMECFERSAAGGSLRALFNLGACHINLVTEWSNRQDGLTCMAMAVERGHPEAGLILETLVRNGIYERAVVDEAFQKARKAVAITTEKIAAPAPEPKVVPLRPTSSGVYPDRGSADAQVPAAAYG